MDSLVIKSGGVLVRKFYENKECHFEDVSDVSFIYLQNWVDKIEDDVVLRDLFLMMSKSKDFYALLFDKCFFDQYLEVALNAPPSESSFQYVELTKEASLLNGELSFSGLPIFSGCGLNDDGEITTFALDFNELGDYIDVPFRVDERLKFHGEQKYFGDVEYSLYDILVGIMWEISFTGGPGSQTALRDSICAQVQGIKDGTVELFSWEDIKEEINEMKQKLEEEKQHE